MLEGILNVFRALLTPVIAGAVAYIAYQQYKTNRDKLRLDLYNKRFEVFRSLMILLEDILRQANVKLEQIEEFSRGTKEAVFLFDEGILTYLKTIRTKALNLWAAEETMEPLPAGKERSAKVAEVRELCDWFTKQYNKVALDKFGKYLKFEQKVRVKAMNWKRGFKRITFVLSLLAFTFWVAVGIIAGYIIDGDVETLWLGPLIGLAFFTGIWAAYFLLNYIVIRLLIYIAEGFRDDKPKDSKNNK